MTLNTDKEVLNEEATYVIYKEDGKYKGTPKINYDAQVQDATMIQNYDDFESAEQIIDYLTKYTTHKDKSAYQIVEEKETKKEVPETFEDKMDFLKKDEAEAIEGYDLIIDSLDPEKDAFVIEQLKKIRTEEEAHKKYLEEVKNNRELEYTEPLDTELEEGASYKGLVYYEYPKGSKCHVRETPSGFVATDEHGTTLGDSKTKAGAEALIDDHLKGGLKESKKDESLNESKKDNHDNWISVGIFGKDLDDYLGDGYIQFFDDEDACTKEYEELTFDKLLNRVDTDGNFYVEKDSDKITKFLVDRMHGDDTLDARVIDRHTDESLKEGSEKIRIIYGNSSKEARANDPIEVTAKQYKDYLDNYSFVEIIEDDKDLAERITEVLDDYGILYGDIVDYGYKVNIVGVDEEEWPEVVDAIKTELGYDVIVPDADHEELDDELVIMLESLKEDLSDNEIEDKIKKIKEKSIPDIEKRIEDYKKEQEASKDEKRKHTLDNKIKSAEKEIEKLRDRISELEKKSIENKEAEDKKHRDELEDKISKKINPGKGHKVDEDEIEVKEEEIKAYDDFGDFLKDKTTSIRFETSPKMVKVLKKILPNIKDNQYTVKEGTTSGGYPMKFGLSATLHVKDLEECPKAFRYYFNDSGNITEIAKVLAVLRANFDELEDKISTHDSNESLKEDNEVNKKYVYQFTELNKEDLRQLKKYNLKYLGKVSDSGYQPGDYAVEGTLDDLKKYCDEYLSYKMNPDYIYKSVDFDTSILEAKSDKMKPTIYNILGWLANHKEDYKEFRDKFESLTDATLEDIKAWIKGREELCKEYEEFFKDKLCSESLKETVEKYDEKAFYDACDNGDIYCTFAKDEDDKDFLIVDGWEDVSKIQKALKHDFEPKDKYDTSVLDDYIQWGFSDEYAVCDKTGKLIRTAPDSYSWTPDFFINDRTGEIVCGDYVRDNPAEYIEWLLSNPEERANTILSEDDLEAAGFEKVEGDYESGWYDRHDSPAEILEKAREEYPDALFIFNVTGQGQFATQFDLWKSED